MRRAGQTPEREIVPTVPPEAVPNGKIRNGAAVAEPARSTLNLPALVSKFDEHPFNPAPESHLIDLHRPMETPSEEFRSLRTRPAAQDLACTSPASSCAAWAVACG